MVKLRTIILISLSILFFMPISGAIGYNHEPLPHCFDCHNSYYYGETENDECGNCHNLYFENPNFKKQHEPLTCKGCHGITTKESFHIKHANSSCMRCHIDNTIPDNPYNECSSCHIGGLHPAHIEKSCEMCHKNTIPSKLTPKITPKTIQICEEEDCWEEIVPEINIISVTKELNTTKPITNYKKFTIYEVLMNLYKQIVGDIYEI